jgi:hypothetical protein
MNFQVESERIGVPFHPISRLFPSVSNVQQLPKANFLITKFA